MGKRKAKPLLVVKGILHLSESFVEPSQESGLLNTVGGNIEHAPGLILAPNYGYAISASSLAKKEEEDGGRKKGTQDSNQNSPSTDNENVENETPVCVEEAESPPSHEDLSVAELVRHIGGAKDKPFLRGDIVDDRPESEKPQEPIEEDDPETAKFYESLGIVRPTAAKDTTSDTTSDPPTESPNTPSEEALSPLVVESEDRIECVKESIAEFYKNYPTEYVYSLPPDPHGNERLQFSLPITPYEEEVCESSETIVDIARRAQKAKRDYERRKAALEKRKASGEGKEEEEEVFDPLPMEVVPSSRVTGPTVSTHEATFSTYWEYVQVDPYDFNRWSFLIQFAESTNMLYEIRRVYSGFLPLFPYCFAYWMKYSEIEKAHNYLPRALNILEKGLEFVPLSVELWMAYINLFAEIHGKDDDFENVLRHEYELGINRCGMGFRSDALWESFISWELSIGKTRNAFVLYKRLVQVPTRLYNRHWDNCKVLIRDYHPRDFLSHDDYESLRRKGCKVLGFRYKEEPEIEPGEIRKTKKPEDKLMAYVKERVTDKLGKVHSATALQADKRWDFEDKIKRPYFHVKALDKGQLWNWEQYLTFEIGEGNHDRIVLLFERCLVACAHYERFWCKYGRYLEKYYRANPGVDLSTHVQQNKVNVHIIPTTDTEEEDRQKAVELTMESIVNQLEEEETIIHELMQSMLNQLEEGVVEMSGEKSPAHLNNLCDNSEKPFAELPPDQSKHKVSSSAFTALIQIPSFPPPPHQWHQVVRDIYTRAAIIHCPRKPIIRLQWAAFEEEIENVDGCRELLNHCLDWHPNFLQPKLHLIDMERRNGKQEDVIRLYDNLLNTTKSKEAFSIVSMKYARFLFKEMGCPEKGLKVLRSALKEDSGNERLYTQVYDMCYHRFPQDRKGAFAALELAARAENLKPKHKVAFARKRVQLLQEHGDLHRYRNALDDLYELEAVVRQEEEEERKWREFESRMAAEKAAEVTRSLAPFPVPTTVQKEKGVRIPFERLDDEKMEEGREDVGSTDVGPSVPYAAVPPVPEFVDSNYGYGGRHPDVKLAEKLGHKAYEAIEAKGYSDTVKDTEEDLAILRERKRKNPLYIVPPRGSFYLNSDDPSGPGLAKKLRLEAPVLLSDLITPNSAPCVNVPDWFVKEGGELCLSETVRGFSVLRYWPHFLSEDGNVKMFKSLRKSVKWHQKQILTSFGTWRHVPRLVSWLGPCEYSHTGLIMPKCENWTPEILDLLHRLVQLVNYEFNSCSLNLYRTGHDSNAWHADVHPALGSNPVIASVSLGALRTFEMKRKGLTSTNFIRFPLFPGSLLIMEGATQADWLHQVPKEPATKGERLNLTFRIMHALSDDDPFAPKAKEAEKESETPNITQGEKGGEEGS